MLALVLLAAWPVLLAFGERGADDPDPAWVSLPLPLLYHAFFRTAVLAVPALPGTARSSSPWSTGARRSGGVARDGRREAPSGGRC
jgi:hypothetical protein